MVSVFQYLLTVDVRVQARSRGGGELDSHKEVSLLFAGPGEIKRMEVVLDPQDSPEEIKSREVA